MIQAKIQIRLSLLLITLLLGNAVFSNNENTDGQKDTAKTQIINVDKLEQDYAFLNHIDEAFFEKLTSIYYQDENRRQSLELDSNNFPIYNKELIAERLHLLNHQTPFNLEYNERVQAFIHLYNYKKRDLSERVLGLSKLYFPLFEEILDQYNLPLEFKYLAVVESALNPTARSRAGAVGLWQFMYTTGKMFDLNVTSYIDERMDPIKSTHAACKYFQYLHSLYGNWELVMAAYNCGPGNVNKAIRRSGGKRDFWEIYPYLPRETRGYVPAFIAVNYVMNYAPENGLKPVIPLINFTNYDTLHVNNRISFEQIANTVDLDLKIIESLNPQYKNKLIPLSASHNVLRLPTNKVALFVLNEDYIFEYDLPKEVNQLKHFYDYRDVQKYHYVKSGEYLSKIAAEHRVSVNDIMQWNNLRSTNIQIGQKLIIQTKEKVQPTEQIAEESTRNAQQIRYYNIQENDTLWDISNNTGLSLRTLYELNEDVDFNNLKAGDKIKIVKNG